MHAPESGRVIQGGGIRGLRSGEAGLYFFTDYHLVFYSSGVTAPSEINGLSLRARGG